MKSKTRSDSTPTTANRERVTSPSRIRTPSTDPCNEVLWQPDPEEFPTGRPGPTRLYRPRD